MVGFVIKALTDKGTLALDRCLQEEKLELVKKSLVDRKIFERMWIRKTTLYPLTDSWQVNPNALRILKLDPNFSIKKIVAEVELALFMNGAEKDDYSIVVEE